MQDPLREQLQLLARTLQPNGISLIVGGGYGLLLRTEHIRRSGLRTRFAALPTARSTSDIDIFLSAEVITDLEKFNKIRESLDQLGYVPIETAKFYQFVLPITYAGFERGIKIDLLAAPARGENLNHVRQDDRRIKPRGAEGLHAHTTPEALTVEENALPLDIGSKEDPLVVYVPHPFSYLLLKLFALRDQLENEAKGFGAYHAFDIYRTVGLATAVEWDEACALRDRYLLVDPVPEACELVRDLFGEIGSKGISRLLDHAEKVGELISEETLRSLCDDLRELLPIRREP